jgi:hypothetical protein
VNATMIVATGVLFAVVATETGGRKLRAARAAEGAVASTPAHAPGDD